MISIWTLVAVLALADALLAYVWLQERQRHAETKRQAEYTGAALRWWRKNVNTRPVGLADHDVLAARRRQEREHAR